MKNTDPNNCRRHSLSAEFYLWHTLMIAVMCLIFYFSSQPGETSRNVSGGVLTWILKNFAWFLPEAVCSFLNHWIRKTAHYLIYLLLGFFSAMTMKSGRAEKWPGKGWIAAALYSCTDEFHQLFVPERSGQFGDVCLDSLGALTGVLLAWFLTLLLVRILNHKRNR